MKKRMIFLAFFVFLYMAPVNLALSSIGPAIGNESQVILSDGENWLVGWHYREKLNFYEVAGSGTNYQFRITVYWNSTYGADGVNSVCVDELSQTNFTDVRFTDNDGSTELDYWLESTFDSTNATFWFELADDVSSGTVTAYIYYRNFGASYTGNGTDTFLFYEDWTSETIDAKWTIGASDGSVSWDDTDANHGSVIKVEGNAGANRYYFYSDDGWSNSYALRMRTKAESTVASAQITQIGWADIDSNGYQYVKSYQGADYHESRDDDANVDSSVISGDNFDAYHVFEMRRDGTNTTLYTDNVLEDTGDCSPDVEAWQIQLYCRDSEYDLYNDWVCIRKLNSAGEPYIFEVSDFAQWSTYEWVEIVDPDFIFYVPIGEETLWAINAWYIVLGMILVPASALYLVRGGKKDMSMDKVFFVMIAFFIGWALIIGGVTP